MVCKSMRRVYSGTREFFLGMRREGMRNKRNDVEDRAVEAEDVLSLLNVVSVWEWCRVSSFWGVQRAFLLQLLNSTICAW